ncbi:MAG TPA: SgcJ/EcaC family oxidoreductase [Xanthomonadaceae bacterium]|nr:SgcJ/EcaC family oxidoreductase [Xanthomonadaceae bacterium]
MGQIMRASAGAGLAWLLLALSTGAMATPSDAALRADVRRANAEWAEAMKTGDAAVIAAPYTDDAVFVLADGSSVRGRAAIEAMYRDGFGKGGTAHTTAIASASLVRDGDLAYESGGADVGVLRDGKPVTRHGRYLTVWQRQGDGHWKIVRNLVLP